MTLPEDFSTERYLELHPDVRQARLDPALHYLNYGVAEGRAYKGDSRYVVQKEYNPLHPKIDGTYQYDSLASKHNHDFMIDPAFMAAYGRGVVAAGGDYKWFWRVHLGLWAARSAAKYTGDFVECGVNRGFLSSAIMHDLDWNNTGRTFYLLDTFAGLDERYLSDDEKSAGAFDRNLREIDSGFYTTNLDSVKQNFAEWPNAKIIQGSIPDTLSQIDSDRIAFLHIDLNCTIPEVAALDYLWDRLVPGAFVLLDDYAYFGYQPQKEGMDEWAAKNDISIASLPTGQGLLIKP
ncbi:TylF/MycF family methyltransferase [Pseudomonas sp. B21-048]|uniref:TylF/MycF family methyltransferase n=1 Tax=Pseudomonas sp. B21-048 TaxID=2895490 RepID=UPI002160B402|nr:TylF/MycF family methyltransferase [Pseudomonas sp. B21-048]UVK98638.1 TylF/MycF family methyltransferase [Pseudomonas sp. B21-048]